MKNSCTGRRGAGWYEMFGACWYSVPACPKVFFLANCMQFVVMSLILL